MNTATPISNHEARSALGPLATALALLREGRWREALILADRRIGSPLFDFEPTSAQDLGLDLTRHNSHRASSDCVRATLARMDINPDDAAVDIGCGKGRAMIAMAEFPFRRVDGVEISPRLAEIARRNLRLLGLGVRTEVFVEAAEDFTRLDDYAVVYLCNPFGKESTRIFIENLIRSLERRPRRLRLIYHVARHANVILESGRFASAATIEVPGVSPTIVYEHIRSI